MASIDNTLCLLKTKSMQSSGNRRIQLEMRNVKHLLSTTSLIPVTS